MLSPFQERVAEIIADLDEAKEFALAGGAALISRGDVDRQTRDLDFFGPTPASVDKLVPAVERVLRDAGVVVRGIQVNPGFARLVVEEHGNEAAVNLAADARLFPAEPGPLVPLSRVKSSPSTRCSPSSAEPRDATSSICRLWKVDMASRTSARLRPTRIQDLPQPCSRGCFLGSIVLEDRSSRSTTTSSHSLVQRFKSGENGRSSWHDLGDETGASAEIKGMTPDWGSEGQPRPDWYTSGHTTSAIPQWHCASPNPKEVAARAGHSSVSFTLDRYGHLLPGSEQRLNDALDDLAQEARTADCLPENGPSDTELPDSTAHADGTQIRRRRHATL